MLRQKLEPKLGSGIIDSKNQSAEMNVLDQNQTEFANLPSGITALKAQELEEYRLQIRRQELALKAERHAWQCELAEKQLLLQSRSAEIEQNRSEIASLRKRIRELELVCQRSSAVNSNAQPQPATVHEELSGSQIGLKESTMARPVGLEKASQENWEPRDDAFVMGEPRLPDAQDISFTRPQIEDGGTTVEKEEKSSRILGSRRWRIRGQKRRWNFKKDKQADSE